MCCVLFVVERRLLFVAVYCLLLVAVALAFVVVRCLSYDACWLLCVGCCRLWLGVVC